MRVELNKATRASRLCWIFVLAVFVPACITSQDGGSAGTIASRWEKVNPVSPLTAQSFAHPASRDFPWVRLNMPASADPAELASEIQDLHDKHIGGIEVGQGAFPSNVQLIAIYQSANRFGIKVSLSHGPTQYPAGYSINDDNARKTLAYGNAIVESGRSYDGPVPAALPPALPHFPMPPGRARREGPPGPPPASPRTQEPQPRTTLVAVLAFRCTANPCPKNGAAELDRASVIDLTSSVTDKNTLGVLTGTTAGNLHWTAPDSAAGAQWQVIAFWTRGVFAQPDPFSTEGFDQLVQSLETGLSPEVKELMKVNRGDIFYDSHTGDRGSADELWTNELPEQFQNREHYDLIPNLPSLFPSAFVMSDGSSARVRTDLYRVRGDLWIETQIIPLKAWVRRYNNFLRVQPEGEMMPDIPITDEVLAASVLDRPEHESLFTNDEVDNYLPIASANHMTGNSWYSTECCAALNMNYAQTFQDITIRMHRSFAGGITQIVYHVYPYRDSPTAKWPGYHNFGPAGFSNAWGPRNPIWRDAATYNDYLTRTGQVLRQGIDRTDVAVYMENFLYPQPQMMAGRGFRMWRDTKLQEAGFTRDYLDQAMLDLPNAVVKDKRLAPDGPAYQALIVNSELEPSTDPDKDAMPLEVAQKLLQFSRAGLPIVVVSKPPDHTPGNTPEVDAQLRQIVAELLAQPNVYQVAHEADVPAKLLSLGIHPAAEPQAPSSLLSEHRFDTATRTDYYFLYNQGVVSPAGEPMNLFDPATGHDLDTEVTMEGIGQPYLLDAWSGKVTPIADYKTSASGITIRVRLSRDNAELLAISPLPDRFGVSVPKVHVVDTTADEAVETAHGIAVLAGKSGTYTTTLSNGRTMSNRVKGVPEPLDLTNAVWQLTVEDWQPANPYSTTFGVEATKTVKTTSTMTLQGLKPWPAIPELHNVSGIGSYTTTFDLPGSWNSNSGAWLDLGEVFDTFQLTVNGAAVPVNQLSGQVDVAKFLKTGENTISVSVATTLNNRLFDLDEDVKARGIIQPYGLVGPVILHPYREVSVYSGAEEAQ